MDVLDCDIEYDSESDKLGLCDAVMERLIVTSFDVVRESEREVSLDIESETEVESE